jgi:hypothetical protein
MSVSSVEYDHQIVVCFLIFFFVAVDCRWVKKRYRVSILGRTSKNGPAILRVKFPQSNCHSKRNRSLRKSKPSMKNWRILPCPYFFVANECTKIAKSWKITINQPPIFLPRLGVVCKLSFEFLIALFFGNAPEVSHNP